MNRIRRQSIFISLISSILIYASCCPSDQEIRSSYLFIKKNISHHYSYDTTGYYLYDEILDKFSITRDREKSLDSAKIIINDVWNDFRNSGRIIHYRNHYDSISIDNSFIMDHTRIKYETWKKNPFTKNLPIDIFYKHILPYRPHDRILPDDYFIYNTDSLLKIVSDNADKPYPDVIDSILVRYKNIRFSDDILPGFPYLTTSSVLKSMNIICEDRVWFNYYMLSAAGIPVAIDFVPNWGNRNAAHVWNVIISDDENYPFEPFYSTDRWEYRSMYNNIAEDGFIKWWGKFRLPKVYRMTFHIAKNKLVDDPRIAISDIPFLFRTSHIEDVSEEYFETTDIEIALGDIPDNCYYAFLAVQNRKNWIPVQYGEIIDGRIIFKNMGKDILYMPVYYIKGKTIPAGQPFFLSEKGEIEKISTQNDERIDMKIIRRYPLNEKKSANNKYLKGSYFTLSNDPEFNNSVKACETQFEPDQQAYKLNNNTKDKYRYVRFAFDSRSYLSQVSVFYQKNGVKDSINLGETAIETQTYSQDGNKSYHVTIDLGESYDISHFGFCGLNDKFKVLPDINYELFYWDNQWISLGQKTTTETHLVYNNIPSNRLYYLDCDTRDAFKRVFTYKDGKQLFF